MISTAIVRTLLCLATWAISSTRALVTSPPATKINGGYLVENVSVFTDYFYVDFTKGTKLDSNFIISTDTIPPDANAPYSRTHQPANVKINAGDSLSLLVPGVKKVVNRDIPSAEVFTQMDDILYGSVRVIAKVSPVAGTCHGIFFFASDNQETDIEILTYEHNRVHFTNQKTDPNAESTSIVWDAPSTMTTEYHEYRLDWLDGSTDFYIDGEYQLTLTENIPSQPSQFLLNNWSNGDPNWSAGPPQQTNDFRVRSVTAYWNRTGVATAAPAHRRGLARGIKF